MAPSDWRDIWVTVVNYSRSGRPRLLHTADNCQIFLHSTNTSPCGCMPAEARGWHWVFSSVILCLPYFLRQVSHWARSSLIVSLHWLTSKLWSSFHLRRRLVCCSASFHVMLRTATHVFMLACQENHLWRHLPSLLLQGLFWRLYLNSEVSLSHLKYNEHTHTLSNMILKSLLIKSDQVITNTSSQILTKC